MRHLILKMATAVAVAGGLSGAARAEVAEVNLAFQFGSNYLPLMIMENQKLVEKQLAAAGLKDTKAGWLKLANPGAIIDAYLVGQIHFSGQGVPSTALIWDKTRNGIRAKAVAAMSESNIYLNTRNPNVKSIKDLTEKDRIAIPSLKSSAQAVFLMMAAEKEWGEGQWGKLDPFLISLPHPDALAAMSNASHEVNAHAATQPFHKMELKAGARTIATFKEAAGGPATGLNFVSTQKFREENPKTYAAVVAAYDEAMDWINADLRRATQAFMTISGEKKLTEDDMYEIISDPEYKYTKVPHKIGRMTEVLQRAGVIKTKPESWKDLYMPEAHTLLGD
jgi:NitT/TauT family transport system substrate-binding protein